MTTDYTDLCKRLREDCAGDLLDQEAADAIEALQEELTVADDALKDRDVALDKLETDNAALRQQIAEAIRLYPQLAERITSSAPDPSFGNPRTP